jgi:hypothetical protein
MVFLAAPDAVPHAEPVAGKGQEKDEFAKTPLFVCIVVY